jgi:methylated-DNA-protein-cysteine methyltransferase-like protein
MSTPINPHRLKYFYDMLNITIPVSKDVVKGRKRKMKRILDEDLIYEILSVVEEIPMGKVATYGQIARLIGREKNSRMVGRVLSMSEFYGSYPCHRVVNHAGRLVPGWREQRQLLEDENVPMKDENHVDIRICQWNC